jgi:hypothetical protein
MLAVVIAEDWPAWFLPGKAGFEFLTVGHAPSTDTSRWPNVPTDKLCAYQSSLWTAHPSDTLFCLSGSTAFVSHILYDNAANLDSSSPSISVTLRFHC